ncbi:MAG: phytanoyl-CoA dioxygenase family protein, partial [Pseudomonadota bacterium]
MDNATLTGEQRARYERDGFLVLRNHIGPEKLRRLDRAIEAHVPGDAYAPGKIYPEPAKYTICRQSLANPDLAFIAEDPAVVAPTECLLGDEAHLTAYVGYVRTPHDNGSGAHNDYKRWRPVGSSMNWIFTIIPLTDFDEAIGPLLVAPGSHQLEKVTATGNVWQRAAPTKPAATDFVDAGLRRGDLLLMNMYTWHQAPPNQSGRRRIGLF